MFLYNFLATVDEGEMDMFLYYGTSGKVARKILNGGRLHSYEGIYLTDKLHVAIISASLADRHERNYGSYIFKIKIDEQFLKPDQEMIRLLNNEKKQVSLEESLQVTNYVMTNHPLYLGKEIIRYSHLFCNGPKRTKDWDVLREARFAMEEADQVTQLDEGILTWEWVKAISSPKAKIAINPAY